MERNIVVRGRDSEEFREAVRGHSVEGYPVQVPIFGPARIQFQRTMGGGFFYFLVAPEKPMPFDEFAKEQKLSDKPLTAEEWRRKHGTAQGGVPPMRPELLNRLDEGGSVSPRERVLYELIDTNCIDEYRRVVCYAFDSSFVSIRNLKRGMLVEFEDQKSNYRNWAGRIVGIKDDGKLVLLEAFTPVPFLETPFALDESAMETGFRSPVTAALGFGTVEAWKQTDEPLPPGKWRDLPWGGQEGKEIIYYLEEPISMNEVARICKKAGHKTQSCPIQSSWLFILPLLTAEGTFRPLPEGLDPEELVYGIDI